MKPVSVTPPAQPGAPLVLRRFGQYVLLRKLAEGGMAELFLAKQVGAEGFERNVVIKCMLDHLSQHPDFVGMFLDEARLAARLFHPNIVQLTDLGVADGRYYICMEYLPGEDLEGIIGACTRRGMAIPVSVATRILLSACEGLEFAHGYQEGGKSVNLVHRDISPSNIIVTYQGVVKVLDFGIAKASSKLVQTQPGTLKGKLGYMSPEQARGEPLDARSDLFSLGVTFYELLTGKRVFQKDNEIGILLALMEEPVPPPRQARPDIPEALERIVVRMLARKREERYQSAAALRADLEAFLAHTPAISSTTQVAQFMQELFSPEQVQRKTQIPMLSELEAQGATVAGWEAPSTPTVLDDARTLVRTQPAGTLVSHPAGTLVSHPTGETDAPRSEVVTQPATAAAARPGGRRTAALLGALGAVLLLAGAGAAVLFLRPELLARESASAPTPGQPPAQPALPAVAGTVVAPPATGAGTPAGEVAPSEKPAASAAEPAPSEVPGTPVAQAPADSQEAADPEPPEDETPAPSQPGAVRKPTARLLTEADVKKVFQRHSARLVACADKHRAELPDNVRVEMVFTIRNSGRPERIQTPGLKSSPFTRCLTRELGAMQFPKNRNDPEMVIQQPIRFQK